MIKKLAEVSLPASFAVINFIRRRVLFWIKRKMVQNYVESCDISKCDSILFSCRISMYKQFYEK